jgi:hypothetical protein
MQTTGSRLGESIKYVYGNGGIPSFYRGIFSALQQRVITTGPMFLFSEMFTQAAQMGGLERGTALFVGSAGSGYMTGMLAAIVSSRACPGAASSAESDAILGVLLIIAHAVGVQESAGEPVRANQRRQTLDVQGHHVARANAWYPSVQALQRRRCVGGGELFTRVHTGPRPQTSTPPLHHSLRQCAPPPPTLLAR